jgi:ABC-type phosphate transport system substrate-binding protein
MSVTEPNVNKCTPMIVPFAFFVNNTVTKNGGTIDSISYDNLQLIFSGNVFNWSEIFDADGVAYDAQPLVACMRHAGSGTQASLEAYLMASSNCSKYNYLAWQQSDGLVYFNDGSSDMMKCVNGYDNWLGTGAIGYADADQTVGTGTPYPNTSRIQLNGVPYTLNFANMKAAMVNGQYNFYGAQHLYGVAPTDPICTFLANPDNYSAPFAAACEMTYTRKNTCCAWGQTYQGNVCP